MREEGYEGRVLAAADPVMRGPTAASSGGALGALKTVIEEALTALITRRFSQSPVKG